MQEAGPAGFTVEYTRKVYRGDKLIKDEHYRTRYDPENEYVEIGPKKKPKPKPKPADTPETPANGPPGAAGTTDTSPLPAPGRRPLPPGSGPPPQSSTQADRQARCRGLGDVGAHADAWPADVACGRIAGRTRGSEGATCGGDVEDAAAVRDEPAVS